MPKSTRRRTDNVLTLPSVDSPTAPAFIPELSEGDIARRAFELYCDRDRQDGHDVADWLKAERELRDAATSTAA